jgi:hypothetical protein
MWTKMEIQYSCSTCGVTGYGEETVISRFSPQLVAWRRQREEERQVADAAPALQPTTPPVASASHFPSREDDETEEVSVPPVSAASAAAAPERSVRIKAPPRVKREQPDVDLTAKCAWMRCQERRRPTSMYCSRLCSNRKAAHNEKMRREHRDPAPLEQGDGAQ